MTQTHSMETVTLETLVEQAKSGDKPALETLVSRIQNQVYGLAMRMLAHPENAEDATQEILIRIITHLSDFQYKSAFSTWVYRVATNSLLNIRKKLQGDPVTFEAFEEDLDRGLSDTNWTAPTEIEQQLLVEEIKIGCSQALLQCLNPDERIAYILGEIFEINSQEGSYILEITPVTFRKRLSRARNQIQNFMYRKCGLVNPANACRCARRFDYAIANKRLDPNVLQFAKHPKTPQQQAALEQLETIQELERVVMVYRSHPNYQAPRAFLDSIRLLFDSGKFQMLSI